MTVRLVAQPLPPQGVVLQVSGKMKKNGRRTKPARPCCSVGAGLVELSICELRADGTTGLLWARGRRLRASFADIAQQLNDRKIPTRTGRPWAAESVHAILKRLDARP